MLLALLIHGSITVVLKGPNANICVDMRAHTPFKVMHQLKNKGYRSYESTHGCQNPSGEATEGLLLSIRTNTYMSR